MMLFININSSQGCSTPYEWRVRQLKQILVMIKENENLILDAISTDLGRGPAVSRALELSPLVRYILLSSNTLIFEFVTLKEPEIKYVLSNLKFVHIYFFI